MMSTTVVAAWHTSGLPAKVDPWSPGAMASATCCFTSTAPMGSPPAGPRREGQVLPGSRQQGT